MSLSTVEEESMEIRLPAEVDWDMLDKSRFFFLGAALFSGISAALYPAVVLKTRQQVQPAPIPCYRMALLMLRREGARAFYKGFGTSLTGTIPARALYMTALEITKSSVGSTSTSLGFSEASSTTIANAIAGLSASMAAQLVWTPVDVVSQRLMVQSTCAKSGFSSLLPTSNYKNGVDAFRKILHFDGIRGLYRGFGISTLTYAPSSAVWWGSYSIAHRLIWDGIGCYKCKWKKDTKNCENGKIIEPNPLCLLGVQGISAALASGASALITMPLDTIKTRLQVLDGDRNGLGRRPTVAQTMRDLVKEGGFAACYRGLGPRWASMSMSAATMVTTYELLKRLSTKHEANLG